MKIYVPIFPRLRAPSRAALISIALGLIAIALGAAVFVLARLGDWTPGFTLGGSTLFLGIVVLITTSWRLDRGLWMLYSIPSVFSAFVAISVTLSLIRDANAQHSFSELAVDVVTAAIWFLSLYVCTARALLNWAKFRYADSTPLDDQLPPSDEVGAPVPRTDAPPSLTAHAIPPQNH